VVDASTSATIADAQFDSTMARTSSDDFILKVSSKNNGSHHLVMVTEDMAPGDEFPTHKHLDALYRKRNCSR